MARYGGKQYFGQRWLDDNRWFYNNVLFKGFVFSLVAAIYLILLYNTAVLLSSQYIKYERVSYRRRRYTYYSIMKYYTKKRKGLIMWINKLNKRTKVLTTKTVATVQTSALGEVYCVFIYRNWTSAKTRVNNTQRALRPNTVWYDKVAMPLGTNYLRSNWI
jgi:hypothetical protein